MARRFTWLTAKRSVRSNPDILGHDIGQLAGIAGGLALTAYVNDKVVSPFVRRLVPGGFGMSMLAQALDAGTTFLTAFGLGQIAGALWPVAKRPVEFGGGVLGASKLVAIPFPNFSISASFPELPGLTGIATRLLPEPAAANGAATVTVLRRQGVGSMGF